MTRTSLNIDAKRVPDKGALFAVLDTLKPPAVVVMDGLGLAREIKSRYPSCLVIHRAWGESEAYKSTSPRTLARKWASEGYGDILTYGVNEPVASGDWSWRRIADWLAESMDEQRAVGLRGVIANWPTGTIPDDALARGDFDNYLRAEQRHAGWHYRGVHDYSGFVLPIVGGGWGGRTPEMALDKAAVQPDKWPAAAEIEADWHASYHLQRDRYLDNRARQIGITPTIRRIVTEFGLDRMPDLEQRPAGNLYNRVTALYGTSGYPIMRGLHTYRDYYRAMFPQWTFEEVLAKQAQWAETVYPAHYVAICWYQWCPGTDDWDKAYGFDMSKLSKFYIYVSQTGEPPVSNPVPKPANAGAGIQVRLRTSSFINVRNAPDTSAGVVAKPANKALLTYYPATKRNNDNYDWYWIELDSGAAGWQAMVYQYPYEQWVTPEPVAMTFRNPADYPHVVTSRMNDPRSFGKHEGLDLASLATAPKPRLVVAAAAGTVERVAFDEKGYGHYIRLYHGSGWRTYYAHLEKALVTVGQDVKEGDVIGWEGTTGNSTGNHLHFTVVHLGYGLSGYVVEDVVNPEPLIRAAEPEPQPEPEPPTEPPAWTLPPLPEIIAGSSESRLQWAEMLRWLADIVEHWPGTVLQLNLTEEIKNENAA